MPIDANTQRLGCAETNLAARSAGFTPRVLALAAACFMASGGALAQQTVIIGGDSAGPSVSATSTVGGGAGGIVINNSVLDSLGPGLPGAGLPMAAPQTPVYGSGLDTPAFTASPMASGSYAAPNAGTSGAYRLPGSGQLVVNRPSTLLYPPITAPQSRLAVAPPARAKKAKTARASSGTRGKLTSRLIATPPKSRQAAPATPKAAAPKVATKSPAPAVKPAMTAPAKPAQVVSAPPIPAKIEPAKPAKVASTPPKPTQIAPAKPAKVASAPPAPSLLLPKVPAPAVPAPKAPDITAPKVAAPAVPSAPAPKTVVAALPPPAGDIPVVVAPSAVTAAPGGDLRLTFAAGSAELSDAAKAQISGLAQTLSAKPSKRLQLLAYAADSGGGKSRARRLSLSRALAVRAFLIDQGVRSTRMDVRALGSKTGNGPADRVDIQTQ